jgi:RHS repeat-associated protein
VLAAVDTVASFYGRCLGRRRRTRPPGNPNAYRPELDSLESRFFPGEAFGIVGWGLLGSGLAVINRVEEAPAHAGRDIRDAFLHDPAPAAIDPGRLGATTAEPANGTGSTGAAGDGALAAAGRALDSRNLLDGGDPLADPLRSDWTTPPPSGGGGGSGAASGWRRAAADNGGDAAPPREFDHLPPAYSPSEAASLDAAAQTLAALERAVGAKGSGHTGGRGGSTALGPGGSQPALATHGTSLHLVEGQAANAVTVATFTDPDGNLATQAYHATITWGDGQTSAGTIVSRGHSGFAVTGSHTYAEEATQTARVSVSDSDGSTGSATSTLTVSDAPLVASGVSISTAPNASFNGKVASFSDVNPGGTASTFTATITWGNSNTSNGTILANTHGGFDVTGSNVYANAGTYPVQVQIRDAGGSSTTTSSTAVVSTSGTGSGGTPLSASGTTVSATEGVTVSAVTVATFTGGSSSASAYQASIFWGDGQTAAGTIAANGSGGFTVTGSHRYAQVGQDAILVVLTDNTGTSASASSTATVADATLTLTGSAFNTTAGTTFSGTAATLSDADQGATAGNFSATIDWGDGTTSDGTVSADANGNGFVVSGSHSYTNAGSFTTTVQVADSGGSTASAGSTATVGNQVSMQIAQTSTTTTASTSGTPAAFGQMVTFSAAVRPTSGSGTPTGTVTFKDGSTTLGSATLSNGTASLALTSLAVGSHGITESYSGDSHFTASTSSTLTQTVQKAGTSTTVATGTSVFGQAVSFTATVAVTSPGAGTPTGTVTFQDGTTTLGSATLSNGSATLAPVTLSVGSHSITAAYAGDGSFNPSTSPASVQTVNQASTTTTLAAAPSTTTNFGQAVTFTATVAAVSPGAGQPTGTVTFKDGSTTLGTGNVSGGQATFTTTTLAVGAHAIGAAYGGDSNFKSSTASSLTQTINAIATTTLLTVSPASAGLGQTITLTATVSGVSQGPANPTGTVTFLDGSTSLGTGTLNAAAQAAMSIASLAPGNHPLSAVYGGDSGYSGSTASAVNASVAKGITTTTLTTSLANSTYGQAVTFSVSVGTSVTGWGSPSGTVTLSDSGNSILATLSLSGGSATWTVSNLGPGTHTITAAYGGDSNFGTSTSSSLTQTVQQAGTSLVVASSANPAVFGQAVTFTATLTVNSPGAGSPTGTISFLDGTASLGTVTLGSGGQAVLSLPGLPVGSHTITAVYAGNGYFLGTTSAVLAQSVNPATTSTALASSANPSAAGQAVTFTATVSVASPGSGTPTGSITFADGSTTLGSATLSGGVATLTTAFTTVASHSITASYAGDGNFAASSAALTQTVTLANTSTVVTSSANPVVYGQAVTFTATVSISGPGAGQPTGTVTFTVDGQAQAPVTLGASGQVTFQPAALLTAGSHTVTAAYSGDSQFAGSGGTLSQVVNPGGTSTSVASSANPTVYGQAVSFTATVTPTLQGGSMPTGTVTFTLDGTAQAPVTLDSSGHASFNPTGVLVVGSHTVTVAYSGDGNYNTSASAPLTQTVNQGQTVTVVTSSLNPSTYEQAVTFTATVTPTGGATGTPTGTVTFTIDGTAQATVTLNGSGQGTLSTTQLTAGSHAITASYSGDSSFKASTSSALNQGVQPDATTTALSLSVDPADYGQAVTITATVAATVPTGASGAGFAPPGGTVAVMLGNTQLGLITLSGGTGSCTLTTLPVGTDGLTGSYSGDGNDQASVSTTAQEIVQPAPTSTSVVSSSETSVYGQSVTFTATVTVNPPGAGQPAGSVQFTVDDGPVIATVALNNGQAAWMTASLSVGLHNILATYVPNADFASSSDTVIQTVNTAKTSVSLTSDSNPALVGQEVTFTATVSVQSPGAGTPTGEVEFSDGVNALENGTLTETAGKDQATTTFTYWVGGNYTITAEYLGDNSFQSSTSGNLTLTVDYPEPTIGSLDETTFDEGEGDTTIEVQGSGFTPESVIEWNGEDLNTTYEDPNNLDGTIPAGDLTQPGTDIITVSNPAPGGGTSPPVTVTVVDPPIGVTVLPFQGTEGSSYNLTSYITDIEAGAQASEYAATVDWGDGNGAGAANVVADIVPQRFDVIPSQPGPTEEGRYDVTVAVTDSVTGVVTQSTAPLELGEATLSVQGQGVGAMEHTDTGSVVVATFTDAGGSPDQLGDYTATINWGDGSSSDSGSIDYNATQQAFTVSGSHTYDEAGDYPLQVTIEHNGGSITVDPGAHVNDPLQVTAQDITGAVEGQALDQVPLATFTDVSSGDNYTATVDWGDGSAPESSAAANSPISINGMQVVGSHTYAEESDPTQPSSHTVTVTVMEDDGSRASGTATADVTDATLTAAAVAGGGTSTGLTVTGNEGESITAPVASFNGALPNDANATYTATINWGDGTTPDTVDVSSPDTTVSGTHTYEEAGPYPIRVTLDSSAGGSVTANSVAQISDPSLTVEGTSLTASAGQALGTVTVATISDPYPGDDPSAYTATIDWGDGTAPEPGSVINNSGSLEVEGDHTYAQAGAFTTVVAVRDEKGLAEHASGDVTVSGDTSSSGSSSGTAPPGGYIQVSSVPIGGIEGQELAPAPGVVVASFTNDSLLSMGCSGCNQAMIDWGDGTAATAGEVVANSDGSFDVYGEHTYTEEGTFAVGVTVHDGIGDQQTGTSIATITDAEATATGADLLGTVGQPLNDVVVASIHDAAGDDASSQFTTTIDWGDGTPLEAGQVVGSGGEYWVVGSHTYTFALDQPFNINVTIDPGENPASDGIDASGTATMAAAAGGLAVSLQTAAFTDADPQAQASDYTAQVDWGDGQTAGGSVGGGSPFTVSGQHTYAGPGTYTVQTTVTDHDATMSADRQVTVADGGWTVTPLSASPPKGTEGQDLGGGSPVEVGDFSVSGVGPTPGFTAIIDWGDGQRSDGDAVDNGSDVQVEGQHTYAEEGTYTVAVCLEDASGRTCVSTTTVTVDDDTLTADSGADFQGVSGLWLADGNPSLGVMASGTPEVEVASFQDANANGPPADHTATIDWGDGRSTVVDGAAASNTDGELLLDQGTVTVLSNHAYAQAGTFSIHVTLDDKGGQSAQSDGTATIADFSVSAQQRTNEANQAQWLPLLEGQVAPNTGSLRLQQALDFDQSPGTAVGGDPALVYDSSTVDVRPLVETTLTPGANQAAPTAMQLDLYLDGGSSSQTFTPDPAKPLPTGGSYVLGVAAGAPLTASGRYSWTMDVSLSLPDGSTALGSLLGAADAVVRDNSDPTQGPADTIGAGWGIAGVDHLLLDCQGVFWEYGSGGSRYFSGNADGTFSGPPTDFGHLVQNVADSPDGPGFTYTAKDGTQDHFDPHGLLTAVVDPHQVARNYAYDDAERLVSVTTPDGGQTDLAYDGSSELLVSITEPGGRQVQLSNDGSDVTDITDADGNVRTLTSDGSHHITEDHWGPLQTGFAYDSGTGLLTGVVAGLGTSDSSYVLTPAALQGTQDPPLELAAAGDPTGSGLPTQVTADVVDPLGHTTAWSLDVQGRSLAEEQLAGTQLVTTTWQRDEHGQVVAATDPRGFTTFYTYDYGVYADGHTGAGDLLQVDSPDGSSVHYQYEHTFHHVTEATDGLGQTTTSTYDPNTGDLLTTTDPLGNTSSNVWGSGPEAGLLLASTDADGRTTSYGYDSERHLTATTDALNQTTSQTYDQAGNPASRTDAAGRTTLTSYDGRNELVVQINPAGDSTTSVFDAYGDPTATIDGRGLITENEYDGRGYRTATIEGVGQADARTSTYEPDAAGNVTATVDPAGNLALQAFDDLNRVTASLDAAGNTHGTAYDLAGNVTLSVDGGTFLAPLGGNEGTSQSVDALNRVTLSIDPAGQMHETAYDRDGQVTATLDSGGGFSEPSERYYDADGRLILSVTATGRATTMGYDPAGDMTATQELGRVLTESDGSLTVTPLQTPEAATLKSYDADHQLTLTTSPDGTGNLVWFDGSGQVTASQEGAPAPGGGFLWRPAQQDYTDGDGRVTLSIDPAGQATSTGYDLDGNVTLSQELGYMPNPQATPVGGNLPTVTAYDDHNEATLTTDPAGEETSATIDADGQQLSSEQVDAVDGQHEPAAVEQHDGAGRLTLSIDAAGQATSQSYDADGNLTLSLVYPAATGPTGPGVRATASLYDLDHRVTWSQDPAGQISQNAYNPVGDLTGTQEGNRPWSTMNYDLDHHLTWSQDPAGVITQNNLDGLGNVTQTIVGLDPTQPQNDHVSNMSFDGAERLTLSVDPAGVQTQEQFDGYGNVTATVVGPDVANPALDHVTIEQLDLDKRVTQTTDPAGQVDTTQFSSVGDVTASAVGTDWTSSTFDGDHHVLSTVDAAGDTTSARYNSYGDVTASYTGSERTPEAVDAANRITQTVDAAGETKLYDYDVFGQVTQTVQVADPNNRQNWPITQDAFDGDGRLTWSQAPDGTVRASAYDGDGNVTASTVQAPHFGAMETTAMQYDLANRPTLTIDPDQNAHAQAFDTFGNVTATQDGLWKQAGFVATEPATSATFDADNREVGSVDAAGVTRHQTLDSFGNVIASQLGSQPAASMSYDGDNRETWSLDAAGTITQTWGYSANGDLTATQDGNQNPAQSAFDGAHHQTWSQDAAGVQDWQGFDQAGNVTATTLGATSHAQTQQFYDGDNHLTLSISAMGDQVSQQYDPEGNLTQTQVGALVNGTLTWQAPTLHGYDSDQCETLTVQPSGLAVSQGYDSFGNVTASLQGAWASGTFSSSQVATQQFYDADNQVTLTWDQKGDAIAKAYDDLGNMTQITDPLGNQSHFGFDGDNHQTWSQDPLGNTATAEYDAATGWLKSQTDRDGRTKADTYDADGRLLTETWTDNQHNVTDNRTFGYDPATGNVISAGNTAGGNYTYQFDTSTGRMTQETEPWGVTVNFSYDDRGNRTLAQDSLGGSVNSTCDLDNRLASRQLSTNGQVTLQLDVGWFHDQPLSLTRWQPVQGTLSVVGTTACDYTVHGAVSEELTSLVHENGQQQALASYGYQYDPQTGRLTEETDAFPGANATTQTTDYGYDRTGQLTSDGPPTAPRTEVYHYDANGNPDQVKRPDGTGSSTTATFQYVAAQGNYELQTDGTWQYTYDAEGNVITMVGVVGSSAAGQSEAFTYDLNNQLTGATVTDALGHTTRDTFRYDVYGNRIEKTVSGNGPPSDTRMVYDDNQNAWADLDANNALQMRRLYLDGIDQLFARVNASGSVAWYLTDHLGSVRDIMDGTGAILDHLDYEAFGAVAQETAPTAGDRMKFTSREWDAEIGQQDNRGREDNPQSLQFTGQDAKEFGQGDPSNPYRYAGNNPTGAADPTGQEAFALGAQGAKMALEHLAHHGITAAAHPLGQFSKEGVGQGVLYLIQRVANPKSPVEVDWSYRSDEQLFNALSNLRGCHEVFYKWSGGDSLDHLPIQADELSTDQRLAVYDLNSRRFGDLAQGTLGYEDYEKLPSLNTVLSKDELRLIQDQQALAGDPLDQPGPLSVGSYPRTSGASKDVGNKAVELLGEMGKKVAEVGLMAIPGPEDVLVALLIEKGLRLVKVGGKVLLGKIKEARLASKAEREAFIAEYQALKNAPGGAELIGGARTGQTSLNGLRDARNLTNARLQQRNSTCGLHSAQSVIGDINPQKGPLDYSGVRNQIRGNNSAGLSTIELDGFIRRNVPDDVAVLIEYRVGEERLLEMLGRGEVISHVDGNHWVRVLGTLDEGGTGWVRVYDPARGNYEQLLTSFLTRSGPNNQMIWIRPPRR